MEANDDDFTDKLHNGDTAFIDESKNDDSSLCKSDFFSTPQNDDVEKLSLLDRFLSSEVVENGKANSTELIGDELVDEPAMLDENALLDEITNDLDNSQEELDDECLLEEDITEIVAKDDKPIEEVTSSQPDLTISPADKIVDDVDIAEEEHVVGSSEAVLSSEMEVEPSNEPDTMEMEEEDNEQNKLPSKENDTIETSSDKEVEKIDENIRESNEAGVNEPVLEKTENILKVDVDNDNNLLEEMVDSPRSSEHESMTSDLLEKDDAVTHDSNDDEKIEQQLIVESSNENSNMSESGVMGENGLDVVTEFKHDGEIHIMDEASVETKFTEAENVAAEVKCEMETGADVKMENEVDGVECKKEKAEEVVADHETSSLDNLTSEKSTDEHPDDTVSHNTSTTEQSSETLTKRKNETEVSDEPETKRKRVEEDPINSENASSSEVAVADGDDIDAAENDDNVVESTTEANGENQKESTENSSKDDDDDVLIVGEIKQTESSNNKESSTATEVQEPVQKAKILILDTEAIANDLGEEETSEKTSSGEISGSGATEKEPEVSSSLDESAMQTEDEPQVESTEESHDPKVATPLVLDPPPQKTLCPTAFSLNFVRKFQKNFDKMTRNDLEELLIQKCVEVIVHKSEYADMRNKIEKQESKLQSYSTKYQELSKQYRDLEMVHQRVVKDLELKNQSVVTPVKITRAVGLQVSLPRKEIIIQKPSQAANTMQTTAQLNNAALAKNRRKIPVQPNPQMQQQQQQQIIRQNMLARRNELQIQQRNQFQVQQQGQNNLLKQQLIQNNQANNFKQQANGRKPVTPQFSPVAANQMQNAR